MKNILITSPIGHTSTRLLANILLEAKNFHTPNLNSVGEFSPLHQYFINSERQTKLNDELSYDYEELSLVLDSYCIGKLEDSKVLVKMPYYPLQCLEYFNKYFVNDLLIIYLTRPVKKVIKSFKNRGEDKSFFSNAESRYHYVKKLPVRHRAKFLAKPNFDEFINLLFEIGDEKIQRIESENNVIRVKANDLTEKTSLSTIFNKLGLDLNDSEVDELIENNVDIKRLRNPNKKLLKISLKKIKKLLK